MNWLTYLAEANAYLVVFYMVYKLLLAKDTHYQLNRAYLLVSSLMAFVLPLVQLNFLKPTVYLTHEAYTAAAPVATPIWQTALVYGYLLGVGVLLLLFVFKLIQLKRLTNSGIRTDKADHHLIKIEESNTAFSFFNYLFMGSDMANERLVINHELIHIRQKHSIDIVFSELLKAINWFNPVVYMLQNSIRTVHEYIADEQASQSANNTVAYASFLLANAYGQTGPAITHSFYNQNLLKKRIMMLDQKRSGKLARLKYLVAVPLCAALLGESTLGFSKSYGIIGIGEQKTASLAGIDTTKKSKVTVYNVLMSPNQKAHAKGTKVVGKDTVKYGTPPPPPMDPDSKHAQKSGKKLPPPPPPMPPKVDLKAPKPEVSKVKFPPPPPPTPPKKASSAKAAKVKPVVKDQEIRIEEPVPAQTKQTSDTEIRISE